MADIFKQFKRNVEKMTDVTTDSSPPKYWLSTGNYVMNKTISGDYSKGFASSRVAMVTGPSSAGKSFVSMQAAVESQKKGYGVFIVDTEHAIDDNYMEAVGVDIHNDLFFYHDVKSLEAGKRVITDFINTYRENKDELPPFLILVDSMDQLKTKSHVEKSEKGEVHNDQGQHAKQLKQFAADIGHEIKSLDIFAVMTKQPYKNQDPIMSKVQPYIITEAMRYPFSQIVLLTNRRVKDKKTRSVEGIELKVFAEKTRFCKPFQSCAIDVPYASGINPYSGMLEAAEELGVVTKSGYSYVYKENKFQKKNADPYLEQILEELIAMDNQSVVLSIDDDEDES